MPWETPAAWRCRSSGCRRSRAARTRVRPAASRLSRVRRPRSVSGCARRARSPCSCARRPRQQAFVGRSTSRARSCSPRPLACGSRLVESATPRPSKPWMTTLTARRFGRRWMSTSRPPASGSSARTRSASTSSVDEPPRGVRRRCGVAVTGDPHADVGVAALVAGPGAETARAAARTVARRRSGRSRGRPRRRHQPGPTLVRRRDGRDDLGLARRRRRGDGLRHELGGHRGRPVDAVRRALGRRRGGEHAGVGRRARSRRSAR